MTTTNSSMKTSSSTKDSQELAGLVQEARRRVATAEGEWKAAKRRCKAAKLFARRSRKKAKQAKAVLAKARKALAKVEGTLPKAGVRVVAKEPAKTTGGPVAKSIAATRGKTAMPARRRPKTPEPIARRARQSVQAKPKSAAKGVVADRGSQTALSAPAPAPLLEEAFSPIPTEIGPTELAPETLEHSTTHLEDTTR